MSTERNLFRHKCDILIEAFHSKKMSINFKKSGYMTINGKEAGLKCGFKKSGCMIINGKEADLKSGFMKSGYMIINGKEADLKCGFKLKAGWL